MQIADRGITLPTSKALRQVLPTLRCLRRYITGGRWPAPLGTVLLATNSYNLVGQR